jgi:hypothetical protein
MTETICGFKIFQNAENPTRLVFQGNATKAQK